MSTPLPTEEEFLAWKRDFVTEWVIKILHARRERMRQEWEGGSYTDYSKDTMILTNVANLGTCKGYAFITDLDYESFVTELDDGERVRPETAGSSGAN